MVCCQVVLHFNPRPPRGGRRQVCNTFCTYLCHFNPRPPRGGRRLVPIFQLFPFFISIHALHGEGDPSFAFTCLAIYGFQSTPSTGRATDSMAKVVQNSKISIHALHGEGDRGCNSRKGKLGYFNPRSPRGGRRVEAYKASGGDLFQSTLSTGRATAHNAGVYARRDHFNPRSPRGGRQQNCTMLLAGTQ